MAGAGDWVEPGLTVASFDDGTDIGFWHRGIHRQAPSTHLEFQTFIATTAMTDDVEGREAICIPEAGVGSLPVAAIVANITYGVWITRASRNPEALPFTLRRIKLIDDRLAKPGYSLLLITGLWMVFVTNFPLTMPRLLAALILYGLLVLTGLFGYTPTLRRQIQLVENPGPGSSKYRAVAKRGAVLGIVPAVLAIAIIYLMVVKPPLWS
jgi:uncharacterized membrane protein